MILDWDMWTMNLNHVLNNNLYVNLFVLSLTLSSIFYLLFRRTENSKRKIHFLAAHIILLFFPFVFSAVFWRCMIPIFNCSPKLLMVFGPIVCTIAIALGFMLLPYIYRLSNENRLTKNVFIKNFIAEQSRKLGINEPEVYSVNEIKPVAYSITNLKPAIFISVGLSELLTRKEMESVLLHELHHHKSKASLWKFSGNALKLFTPLATFTCVCEPMKQEEIDADDYAISIQGTSKHIDSAKRKIGNFNF